MSERAKSVDTAEAAADAIRAYVRLNRKRLAGDGELLALLVPDRADLHEARDFQRYVIDRLAAENIALKAERDGLKASQNASARLGEGVRRFVLDLLDARSFAEAIAVMQAAAPAFGADRSAICVESDDGAASTRTDGVRLIQSGTVDMVLGHDGMGAILSGGGRLLLGPGGSDCKSLAVFRMKIGRETPPALFVLGAHAEGVFEGESITADLRYASLALERAIRSWLDLPRN
jgi:uncharacterized protein